MLLSETPLNVFIREYLDFEMESLAIKSQPSPSIDLCKYFGIEIKSLRVGGRAPDRLGLCLISGLNHQFFIDTRIYFNLYNYVQAYMCFMR